MNAHTSSHASLPAPRAGATVHLLGTLVTFRATAGDTNGAFSLAEIAVSPGAGTPPHHHDDAEAFLVLDGEISFLLAGETLAKGPGDFVHIPSQAVHAFSNESDKPARMLGINLPGGPHERFFAEAGESMADAASFPPPSQPDIPKLMGAAGRHGITILPPA